MSIIENESLIQQFFGNHKRLCMRFPDDCVKAIILAPHPDDETIGCGGIIAKYNNIQMDMTSILATYKKDDMRGLEFINAMKLLNCKYQFIELEDGKIEEQKETLVTKIHYLIDVLCPDIIFTPYLLDFNPDHRVLSTALSEITYSKKTLIAMYEVWTPILYPNYYIDISKQNDKKNSAIQSYQSQEMLHHLKNKAENLNGFRAELLMRKNVSAMEAFKVFDSVQFKKIAELFKDIKLI